MQCCTILAFLRKIRKMSTLSSANVTDVNLVLKECTHMRLCLNKLICTHNLGNWLMTVSFLWHNKMKRGREKQCRKR